MINKGAWRVEERELLVKDLVLTFRTQIKRKRSTIQPIVKHYIPLNEFYVLKVLFEHNQRMTVSEISNKLQVATSHITGVSDRLIKKGLITRERSTTDRRIVYVTMTDKGIELTKEMKQVLYECFDEKFEDFTNEELEDFIYLLKKIKLEKT
ncbi:MarR family transcriptional regulator [Priestia filamentosa]|nr:hypothetical protein B1B01_20865 [Priestia filamentosa]RJS64606.1 MarR family transcriptional regulator [Priestia filamentosa]